jgi:methylated-DNA-[protein]-cysteine S-methyltransferase
MSEPGFALFATEVGPCAVVWGARGLLGLCLPERDEAATRERVRRRHPDAVETTPPTEIGDVIAGVVALLAGEKVEFGAAILDTSGVPEFNRRVYDAARRIPPGETLTYGDIAREVATLAASRAVGRALGHNPWPIIVPCHRVLAASGRTGGFSAPGGIDTKLRILSIEARHATASPGLFSDLPLAAKPAPRR